MPQHEPAISPATTRVPTDASSPVVPEAPPDWNAISEEITCPLCEYNLRGLVDPRCPECGYRFTWREMLDPERRRHPYLFEHHPRRNAHSFWMTLRNGCRPWKFWTSLHPVQPHSARRLLLYYLLVSFLAVPLALSSFLVEWSMASWANTPTARANLVATLNSPHYEDWKEQIILQHGSIDAYLDVAAPLPTRRGMLGRIRAAFSRSGLEPLSIVGPLGLILGPFLIWPWVTFLCLMVFQVSMRRARIRLIHVMRAVVYSYDVILWLAAAMFAFSISKLIFNQASSIFLHPWLYMLSIGILIIAFVYRLYAAYRLYLRFHWPLATVLASQAVAVLLALNIVFGLTVWR